MKCYQMQKVKQNTQKFIKVSLYGFIGTPKQGIAYLGMPSFKDIINHVSYRAYQRLFVEKRQFYNKNNNG